MNYAQMEAEAMARITTGWPPQALMQDDCRELSIWFATRIDARWTLTHRVYV